MNVNRSWMHNRLVDGMLTQEFKDGISEFLEFAFGNHQFVDVDRIHCPCRLCDNLKFLTKEIVQLHLYKKGFTDYNNWYLHGEPIPDDLPNNEQQNVVNDHYDEEMSDRDLVMDMVLDAAGPTFDWAEEQPNPEAQDFYNLLRRAKEPLWEVAMPAKSNVTTLSAVAELLNIKADCHLTRDCMDRILSVVKKLLPGDNRLPKDLYHSKTMVKGLGMPYEKIHACTNDCMLYYGSNAEKTECDICQHPRYKEASNPKAKPISYKILRRFPIAPRLQRLYTCPTTAENMRWHKEGKRDKPEMMVHPADAPAWKEFDKCHPDFKEDPRNIRLGLSADGFTPFGIGSPAYSMWPVYIFPYNLPPGVAMQKQNIFLALLIPGPSHPGKNIDTYLRPLIDELSMLWTEGVRTFDSFKRQNFQMKAALMWTVSNFPAYGMLSGWSTHGNLACPICMGNTKAFRLENGGKPCWFGCHRQFLPVNHPFRDDDKSFKKGVVDKDEEPPRLAGNKILEQINKIDFTDERNNGYGVEHKWTKKSIFWELPYWCTNLIRHNLDLMHIENNNFGNLINTVLDIKYKTKDNIKAHKDMALLCNRSGLELKNPDSPNPSKPVAPYTISDRNKKREVFRWLQELKFPDGYASNWARCVNVQECKFTGLKSHDGHIFMERLLPVVFRDVLPDAVWEPLSELSNFFRDLCAKELNPAHIEKLEKDIVVTLCKLEMIFPPGYFDCMEHLVVHLAYEARIGGPIAFRWMYPIERCIQETKKKVGNKAYAEGSIAEAYLIEEISTFCAMYFADEVRTRLNNPERNHVEVPASDSRLDIMTFPGRPIGNAGVRDLTDQEIEVAQYYVLINSRVIDPFMAQFDAEMRSKYPSISENTLLRRRQKSFSSWIRNLVLHNSDIDERIHNLALGPDRRVRCYNGYIINGYRFHTKAYGQNKRTMNSGVCVFAGSGSGFEKDYYGLIEEIIELQYNGENNSLVLFKCHWFDIDNGQCIDKKHGLVEVKCRSSLKKYDPFVIAWQVSSQVYYLPYISSKRDLQDWSVVAKTKPRSNFFFSLSNQVQSAPINCNEEFFQEDGNACPFNVTNGEQSVISELFANISESVQIDNPGDEDVSGQEEFDEYGRSKRRRIESDSVTYNDNNPDLDNVKIILHHLNLLRVLFPALHIL